MELSTNVHDDKEYEVTCGKLSQSEVYTASNERPPAVINSFLENQTVFSRLLIVSAK